MNMTNKKLIIFDMDGTLLNTIGDLADSANEVLSLHGYPGHSEDDYMTMVGAGISELVRQMLPVHEREPERIRYFVEAMETEYKQRWDQRTQAYPGVPELLDTLVSHGYHLAILSNKPDPFTVKMARALLGSWTFNPVWGARCNVPQKPDPTAALSIAEMVNAQVEDCYFIGDSEIDVKTAQAAGMIAVAVSWGFRSRLQLQKQNPQYIIDKPGELLDILRTRQPV